MSYENEMYYEMFYERCSTKRKRDLHKQTLIAVGFTAVENFSKASPDHSYSRVSVDKERDYKIIRYSSTASML